ncbi:hypothetical protein MY5147_004800 [Beauveria neobassiana]
MEHNYRALQPRDGAPQRPAPLYPVVTKRHAASVACQECRLKRIKCEGRRPICSNCAKRGVDCAYRDELCVSKDARETVVKVVHMLGRMPSSDAIRIIDSTRNEPSAEKILALIRDGLARQNKQRTLPPGCSNPTTPGVQDEYHHRPEALETRHSVATTTHSSTSDPPRPSPRTAHQHSGGTLLSPNLHASSSSSSPPPPPPPPPPNQLESSSPTWSCVTDNVVLTHHLLALYFCWEYPSFAPLSKEHFLYDFSNRRHRYCSPMLVNALLALGCHLSERPNLHGDAFFAESQRLFLASASAPGSRSHQFLPTIQALVIMSLREARCARAVQSQHYAKLAIGLAIEMGLHIVAAERDDEERVVLLKTFWGAFTLHQTWSLMTGTLPEALRLGYNSTPAVLFTHLYYHFAILLLFCRFIKLRVIGSETLPWQVCSQSADAIQNLVMSYSNLYTLRRTASFLPYIMFTATTTLIAIAAARLHLDLGESVLDAPAIADCRAREALRQNIESFIEIAPHHPFASQALFYLQRLADGWGLDVDGGMPPVYGYSDPEQQGDSSSFRFSPPREAENITHKWHENADSVEDHGAKGAQTNMEASISHLFWLQEQHLPLDMGALEQAGFKPL